ncbi:DUF3857 domain-containing transglutaminase family protein [Aquimarina hainanensis]|uniref:DUF3857 domain-containing transglutaminase family protein n=1 Tax=Aquimarina hainanensis TaxID=1578017 RepID=A0ABW5NBC4_9FLAO
MRHKKRYWLFMVIVLCGLFKLLAQDKSHYQSLVLDSMFTKNTNAVLRYEKIVVTIESSKAVVVTTKRAVTVLNKYGDKYTDTFERYDPSTSIKKLEARIYDQLGNEIKKIRKKDFNDHSAVSNGTLFSDSRVKFIEYTPVSYPYTLEFESEVVYSSTAFIPEWFPVKGYKIGVEESIYEINNPNKISYRKQEKNIEKYEVAVKNTGESIKYILSNVPVVEEEMYSPAFRELVPRLRIVLDEFYLEGKKGIGTDWETLGKWQYENLIRGRGDVSEKTIQEVEALMEEGLSDREKAKRIYEYVQKKTRYISVQLGIGSWMPFKASEVDNLGYGDCKALTNYTMALLHSQNIPAYYTVLYAKERRDVDHELAAFEGNHAILNIPGEKEDMWLECTSQTMPFNFIGDFTDNRDVLVITPEGGVIKRTKKYDVEENKRQTVSEIHLNVDRSMSAMVERTSEGLEYDWNNGIQFLARDKQDVSYKDEWGYINNLKVKNIDLKDDKDEIVFFEKISVCASSYLKKAGSRFLLIPNVFKRNQGSLPVYEERKTPFIIERGYIHIDSSAIHLPKGYTLRKIPLKKRIETPFGSYLWEVEKKNDSLLIFKRFLKINDGAYAKEEYEKYRLFQSDVKKYDKSKIILEKQE